MNTNNGERDTELWSLIRAYAGCRIDCDRSQGSVPAAYLALAESNLRDYLDANPRAQLAAPAPEAGLSGALNDLMLIHQKIAIISGSALLAGEKHGTDDKAKLYKIACELLGDVGHVQSLIDGALSRRIAPAEPTWGDVQTVGNAIAQLRTMDPAMPLHGSFHLVDGRSIVRGLCFSRERVVEGRWIDSKAKDVPYSIVAWTCSKEPERYTPSPPAEAAQPPAPTAGASPDGAPT